VPGIARGGVVFAVCAFTWAVIGIAFGKLKFPLILAVPLAFYTLMVVSGFVQGNFSLEYAGQMTTVWIGAIAVAIFIANGVSIKIVLAGLLIVVIGNVVAILIGYDGYLVNVQEFDQRTLQGVEVKRVSGLAGQSNLLVSLMFALPFLVFALRRKQELLLYLLLVGLCIFMMYATASRSTIPFTILFIVCGAFFLLKNMVLRGLFGIGFALVLTAVLYLLSDPLVLSKIEDSAVGELYIVKRTILALDAQEGESQLIRQELATGFWDQYYQKPIFGYGPNQFSNVSGDGYYAHNNFAEIAVNWGTIGLMLYYSMYALILFGIIKFLPVNYYLIAPLAFLAVADFVFVTFTERAMVLTLCVLLLVSHNVMAQDRSSRSSRSGGGRRRRRRARR